MTLILALFAAGAVLLAFEIVLPGAVLGIAGGIAFLIGTIAAFVQFGFVGGLAAALAALVLIGVVLYLEFVFLPKSRLAKRFSMLGVVAGTSQPPVAEREQVVGRTAIAVTVLAPTGYVEVAGRRYEAFARHGYVSAGERLEVLEVDTFRLIVSKPLPSTQTSL